MATEHDFECITHLAHGSAQAHGFDRQVEQVAAMSGSECQRFERSFDGCVVARGFDFLQTCDLSIAHGDVIDVARFDGVFTGEFVFVHANDHVLARVNPCLFLCGSGLNL